MCIAGGAVPAFMVTPGAGDTSRQPVLKTIPAHEHIFFEGDARDHLYIVESGWVKLYRTLVDGQRQIVGFANRGSILGLESDVEHVNGCEAITDVQIRALPVAAERLSRLPIVPSTPTMGRLVLKSLSYLVYQASRSSVASARALARSEWERPEPFSILTSLAAKPLV